MKSQTGSTVFINVIVTMLLRLMELFEKQTNQKADWPERDKKSCYMILQGHMISDTDK